MPKQEVPVDRLQQYLPDGTAPAVLGYLHEFRVQLTITRARASILGDYRHLTHHHQHRISVNGNLNPYAFLITLLHEIAHLLTFERYGGRVAAHGPEWQAVYGTLLHQFVERNVFPDDIANALRDTLHSPAASSCAEAGLLRVLRRYDPQRDGHMLVEELPEGATFRLRDGRIFSKGDRLRKRFKCTEVLTGKGYLFSPVFEVEWLPEAGCRQ